MLIFATMLTMASRWLVRGGGRAWHVCVVCGSTVLAVLSGARTGGNRLTER